MNDAEATKLKQIQDNCAQKGRCQLEVISEIDAANQVKRSWTCMTCGQSGLFGTSALDMSQ